MEDGSEPLFIDENLALDPPKDISKNLHFC
jgi:hypothetical protein